jgi:hypothetical protein
MDAYRMRYHYENNHTAFLPELPFFALPLLLWQSLSNDTSAQE